MIDEENLKLTDLLTVDELQKAQDSFSKMARLAAIMTDEDGVPITRQSNYSRLCSEFCRKSPEGRKRCENCDKSGAILAMEQKKSVYYFCHANLVDFAAPIMLNGRMIGGIVGGQVLAKEPNLDSMRKIAREIDVDEDEFVEAAKETNIIPLNAIERCANYMYEFADLLSDMAYKAYVARREAEVALRAATAKTDFLANMSHEIRTPMNAIIGMSQITLREEMSPQARTNIEQIRSSADMLLTIINDILDYSKIEAGKMAIVEAEYTPVALVKEVTSIIANRIGDKELEFIVDYDPTIPTSLMGDDVRIKQIIVNLANNAVKFTPAGQVLLSLKKKIIDREHIMLCCSVQDTGIGIKEEHIKKLFNSFEQVDSKRNRKIEGTGLGLAIVKRLIDSMGGEIKVESEYEKGSTFSFEIPQAVVQNLRSIEPLNDCPNVLGVISNPYVKAQMEKNMRLLGAQYMSIDENMFYDMLENDSIDYVFIEEALVSSKLLEFIYDQENTKLVIISSINSNKYKTEHNIVVMRKPISVINTSAILQNISIDVEKIDDSDSVLDFVAPDAHVLVVDDNEVNLTVAAGLLEPLNMHIDTAENGMVAIEMVNAKQYDIIFMDHMMPEMDGIETTQMIREYHPEYENIPIVALTANALAGNKELFLKAGLNDYVAKPIELPNIVEVLKKWLPQEKMQPVDVTMPKISAAKKDVDEGGLSSLSFLDTKYSLNLLKSESLFWKVLKNYYNMIDKKTQKIKEYEETEKIGDYIVEVHALKSSSKQIGALALSRKAEYLEMAGNRHEISTIHKMTDELLVEYKNLQNALAPYFVEEEKLEEVSTDEVVDDAKIKDVLQCIREAIDELDLDKVEEVLGQIHQYREEDLERVSRIKEAVQDMDIDACLGLVDEWETQLQ